jgi:nucleolar protein 56
MNKDKLKQQFFSDINSYVKGSKDIINSVKALELISYLTIQSNSIFDYVYKWHSLDYPELYDLCERNNSKYLKTILDSGTKKESVIKEELGEEASSCIKQACQIYHDMEKLSDKLKQAIERSSKKAYPNLSTLLGPILATKFISQVGSLERLSKLPSSTLQLIGAETALFKHLKFGKKCPKYGFIYQHPIMQGLDNKNKGKLARFFASRIELAVRADLYTKKDISKQLISDLEEKKQELKGKK